MDEASKNILSTDDYTKILQKRFETKNISFLKAEWAPFFKNLEGFLGDHYLLKIKYKIGKNIQSEDFFVKTKPCKTALQRKMAEGLNAYEKEIFLYTNMFKIFENMGYNINFAPKCYYFKDKETIVLEDLRNRDYKLFPRGDFYDMDHCKLSLKALAHFHANFIAYEETKSLEIGRSYKLNERRPELFKEFFYISDDKDGPGEQFIQCAVKFFIIISKLLPESKEWKETFEKNIKACDIVKTFCTPLPCRKACTHGDLWSNNMLFKYVDKLPSQCCLLDYQLLRYYHISFDALLVLYSNTSREFRKKHLVEMLGYHYDSFEEILKRYGFEARLLIPKGDYMESAKVLAIVALMQAAGGRSVMLLPKEIVDDAVRAGGKEIDAIMFTDKRNEVALDYFKNNERYRSVITDDIYDLYEVLKGD